LFVLTERNSKRSPGCARTARRGGCSVPTARRSCSRDRSTSCSSRKP